MQFTYKVIGHHPKELEKDLKIQFLTVEDAMQKMSMDAKTTIDLIIRNSKKRAGSEGRLEKSIQVEKTKTGYGVGNLEYMNSAAPYWYILNYGGMVPPTARRVPGFFGDVLPPNPAMSGTGVGRERFTWDRNNMNNFFFMNVKNPIAPVNYIEKINMWCRTVDRVHFSGWTKKTQAFAS